MPRVRAKDGRSSGSEKKQFDEDKLFKLISMGVPINMACPYVGMSEDTFANRCKENSDFGARANAAGVEILLRPLATLFDDLNLPNGHKGAATARWMLEKRFPKIFGHLGTLSVDAAINSKRPLAEIATEVLETIANGKKD